MPIVIEELTTTLEIQDEVRIRKLVAHEVRRVLREESDLHRGRDASSVDPTDPVAGAGGREG